MEQAFRNLQIEDKGELVRIELTTNMSEEIDWKEAFGRLQLENKRLLDVIEDLRLENNGALAITEDIQQELDFALIRLQDFQGVSMMEIAARRLEALRHYREEYAKEHPGYKVRSLL